MKTFNLKINLGNKKEELPKKIYLGLTNTFSPVRFFSFEDGQRVEAITYLFTLNLVDIHQKVDNSYSGQSYKNKEYCDILYEVDFNKIDKIKINEFECIKIEYSYTTQYNVFHDCYFGNFTFYIIDKNGEIRKDFLRSSYKDQTFSTIDNLLSISDDLLVVKDWNEYDELQEKKKEEAEKIEKESQEWQQQDKEKRMTEVKEILKNINQIINFIAEKYDLTKDEVIDLQKSINN
jgi:hypothetical protein